VKIYKAKHYQDLNSLTPDALRDMVSAIYVGAPDKSSGKRQQKIEIYYDGAGFIPLNLLMQCVSPTASASGIFTART
jgi:site-specific DNA recombinase